MRWLALALVLLAVVPAAAQQDTIIVAGQRIGPYRLDLTVADLQKALGPFKETVTDSAPFVPHRVLAAEGPGIDAHIGLFGASVLGIATWKPGYRLSNGVSVGAREVAVNRLFPNLPITVGGPQGTYYLDDRQGLAVLVDLGQIAEIVIFQPGGARRLFVLP